MGLPGKQSLKYILLLAGAFLLALLASWTPFGAQIDNNAYDRFFRLHDPPGWETETVLLAIDDDSLTAYNGTSGLREPLARAIERVAAAGPKVIAVDLILSDRRNPEADRRLAAAFRSARNLVLSCDLIRDGGAWQEPLPEFRESAAAVGHVHAQPDELDSVSRHLPLEKATARDRRWALALEAFRVSRGAEILESPRDLQVGGVTIPSRRAEGRVMRIRYVPPSMPPIPRVSLKELLDDPAQAARFAGKAVFVGMTAQTEVRDRLFTPYSGGGAPMPGVEIHAQAFETMAHGLFLTDAPAWWVLMGAALLVTAAGLAFALAPGWQANALAVLILAAAHMTPYFFFTRRSVFSFATPVSAAWFSVMAAAAYQHLVVRRSLRKAEAERARYQQAMHFVTHEMRTPLTAIQGSSELISRYAMTEEKRKQIAQLINSESKRLGRMIEMFLNVERLSAGEIELKKESFTAGELMGACLERAQPLADRKRIAVRLEPLPPGLALAGDRELMEYAFYNLLNNAIKYSPPQTEVTLSAGRHGEHVRIAVQDQGIGMDQKEIKKIFQKFYRTRKAEQSGEAGTGIGLSIVEQIVIQHGGAIEVTSRPGQGSCFTLVLPARVSAAVAEQH
jgi:signal transduction histidine kinase